MPRSAPAVRACTRCQSTTNEFGKCSKVSDGRTSTCKACQRDVFRLKYQSDPRRREQSRESSSRWANANPAKALDRVKRYQRSKPDAVKASRQRYVAANKDKVYAKNAARHSRSKSAVVPWSERAAIRRIYLTAKQKSAETGVEYVVDHVIPLLHPLVCGLHVAANLRVITALANLQKSNSFQPF